MTRRLGLGRVATVAALMVLGSEAAVAQEVAAFDAALAELAALESDPETDPIRRTEAAAAALRAFLKIPPDAPGYVARLAAAARCAMGAEQTHLAIDLYDEAWRSVGPSEELADGRIRARLAGGKEVEACALAGEWLSGEGLDASQAEGLRPAICRALASAPGDVSMDADRRLRRGAIAQGLALFEAVAEGVDGAPWALGNLALAYRHAGELGSAEATYRRALAAAPGDGVLWNDFGLFLRATGQVAPAMQAFRTSYNCDDVPGTGPGITNLLHMAWWDPEAAPEVPWAQVRTALRTRPDAAMLRRLALEALIDRPEGPGTDRSRR